MIFPKDLDQSIQKYVNEPVPAGMGVIYALIHKTTRKMYIGQTKRSARERYRRHKNGSGRDGAVCPNIYEAIQKHGIDNFEFVILSLCPQFDLDKEEIRLISEHQTHEKDYGYNLAIGGSGNPGLPLDIQVKLHEKRKITMSTSESKSKRSNSAKKSWADESTRSIRKKRSEAKMLKMVEEAEALAVPIPPPHLRKHGAIYIRNGKYYRFYVPSGRPVYRGNLKEISIEAIESKRKESRERMANIRANGSKAQSDDLHKSGDKAIR